MFSRFDNMMQHTQTHNKNRSSRRSGKAKSSRKSISKQQQQHQQQQAPSYATQAYPPGMPSPPPSRRGSLQQQQATPEWVVRRRYDSEEDADDENDDEDDEEEEEEGSDDDSDASYHPPHSTKKRRRAREDQANSIKNRRMMMAQLRRYSQEYPSYVMPAAQPPVAPWTNPWQLPPLRTTPPYSPPRRMMPEVYFHSHPYGRRNHSVDFGGAPQEGLTMPPRRHSENDFMTGQMILPRIASFLVQNPNESPENFLLHHQYYRQVPVQGATEEEDEEKQQPKQETTEKQEQAEEQQQGKQQVKRRLSVQDLCNPIESLSEQDRKIQEKEGVDLTQDEFEALQGFGRFRMVAAVATATTVTDTTAGTDS